MNTDFLLANVAWQETPRGTAYDSDLPYVTHEGVLEVMGSRLRCYRLSDGPTVFNAEDFEAFLGLRGPV